MTPPGRGGTRSSGNCRAERRRRGGLSQGPDEGIAAAAERVLDADACVVEVAVAGMWDEAHGLVSEDRLDSNRLYAMERG